MAKSLPPDRTLADFQAETDRMFATLEPEDQAWLIAVLEAEEEPARTSWIKRLVAWLLGKPSAD